MKPNFGLKFHQKKDHSLLCNFRKSSSKDKKFIAADVDTYLYEVRGNIGERCLPDNTKMLALYKVNPNAEWVLKHRQRMKAD